MSNATASLEKYTAAIEAVKEHEKANETVFQVHKNLVFRIIDAENELRDAVAEEGAGVENGDFKVTVTKQTQTWVDIEVLDTLLAAGKISKELRDSLVKTQERPPRISISAQKK